MSHHPATFHYLFREQNADAAPGDCLDDRMKYAHDFEEHLVVRQELSTARVYKLFVNYEHWESYQAANPALRYDNEVAGLSFKPQKLYFDLDIGREELANVRLPPPSAGDWAALAAWPPSADAKFAWVLAQVKAAITAEFERIYCQELTPELLVEAHCNRPDKYSAHFFIKRYVSEAEQVRLFQQRVKAALEPQCAQFIDVQAKARTNLRMIGQVKEADPTHTPFVIVSEHSPRDALIHAYGPIPVASMLYARIPVPPKPLGAADGPEGSAADAGVLEPFAAQFGPANSWSGVRWSRGKATLSRSAGSFCAQCNTEHTKDNTLWLTLGAARAGKRPVLQGCWKAPKGTRAATIGWV